MTSTMTTEEIQTWASRIAKPEHVAEAITVITELQGDAESLAVILAAVARRAPMRALSVTTAEMESAGLLALEETDEGLAVSAHAGTGIQ